MIRNVRIHVSNEQPLLADIFTMPSASDAGLVCTNVRATDGKKPLFIDDVASTFFFPYLVVRFIEIPPVELERHLAEAGGDRGGATRGATIELPAERRLPVPVPPVDDDLGDEEPGAAPDLDLEIDEGFLQRVRDI